MYLVMPEMEEFFELKTIAVNVTQKVNKVGDMAGGVLVYKDRNTGFTLDNYGAGIGSNRLWSQLARTLSIRHSSIEIPITGFFFEIFDNILISLFLPTLFSYS